MRQSPARPRAPRSKARSRVRTPSSSPMQGRQRPVSQRDDPRRPLRAVDRRLEAGASSAHLQRDQSERRRRSAGRDDSGVAVRRLRRPRISIADRRRPAQARLQPAGEQPRRARVRRPRWSRLRIDAAPRRGPAADRTGARAPRASASARSSAGRSAPSRSNSVPAPAATGRRRDRRCRARADRRDARGRRALSTEPPRHQTSAGRLDSRSARHGVVRR